MKHPAHIISRCIRKLRFAKLSLLAACVTAASAYGAEADGQQFAEPLGEINFREVAARQPATPTTPAKSRSIPFQPVTQRSTVPRELTARTLAPSPAPAPPSAAISPAPAASFAALGDNGTSIPPDTHGAAGPNHLMVTLNTEVQIQSRTGTVLSKMTLAAFWSSLTSVDPFDPKILYDPYNDRWMFTCTANAKSADAAVLIAVSNTSDPTGTWKRYKIKADAASLDWADYPSFGFNKNWIVVSINMFLVGGSGGFDTTRLFIFDKNTLYTGSTAPVVTRNIGGFTVVPAITYDNTVNTLYLVDSSDGNTGGLGFLRLSTLTGTVANPVVNEGTSFPSTSNTWAGVGSTGFLDFAPQLGSAQKIMNNDDRIQNVVYRNGAIWCTHTAFLPASTATRSAAQWWQLTPSGNVTQFGRVDDSTGAKFYAFPSIAVNKNNDALLAYSRFSASQYASANYSFRAAADALNTMQSEIVLKAGEAPYYKTYGGGRNRWGDYSATMVDPVDDAAFWTVQEYASTPSGGQDKFGTWWGRVASTTPTAVTISVNDISVVEGNFGTVDATFTVSLSQATSVPVSVQFATSDGTAVAGSDYDSLSGVLTFPANTTQKSVVVKVRGDLLNEGAETFSLILSNPTGGTIARAKGTCTIPNDDGQLINTTLSNTTTITIPDSGAATPYSSDINVSGVAGRVSRVTVTLKNLTHNYPGDIDVLLVGPTGRTLMVMSDAGTGNPANNLTFTFDDLATQLLGGGPLSSGTTKPTNINDGNGDDIFPSPAPAAPYGSTLSVFNGTNPNGAWKLFVRDDSTGNSGQFAGGWTLDLTTDTSPPPPTVSISDATVIESDTGTRAAVFNVSLAETTTQSVSVNYTTSDDTAAAPNDYTAAQGIVLFLPGELLHTISVAVKGDVIFEPNETFFVTLTPSSNSVIADGEGVGTIQDNDPTPMLSINDVSVMEGDSGTTNVTFNVTLSGPSALGTSVQFDTAPGTALANTDFVQSSGEVIFQPGTTSKTITVRVIGDRVFEGPEFFTVELSAPVNAGIADASGVCTINNDDLVPAVSINNILVTEGNSGTRNGAFTLRLSGPTAQPVTVDFATTPDSAIAPDDFVAAFGTVTFNPGETSKPLSIAIVGDTTSEPAESFSVALSNPQNATLANTQGLATIVNDDDGTPGDTFTSASAIDIPATTGGVTPTPSALTVSGLSAPITRLTVTLRNLSHSHPQDLDVLLVGPTGETVLLMSDVGGTDNANGVTLTFDDAASSPLGTKRLASGTFKPTNLDDAEGADLFGSPAPAAPYGSALAIFNGTAGNGTWQLFVVDDSLGDGGALAEGWSLDITTGNTPSLPALSIDDATDSEGNGSTKDFTFTVTLSATSAQQVTVNYQTTSGSARAGTDFTTSNGTLTFAPGTTTRTFTVPVLGDGVQEPDETFSVTLTGATNAIIADGLGIGTIVNDDNVGTTTTFSNNDGIVIPTNGAGRPQGSGAPIKVDPATPYASPIEVSGLAGSVGKVRVVLTRLDHTFPDDIDMLLVGPNGQSVVLMSDTGGGDDIVDLTLTFDDEADAALPDGSPILARTVLPTNFGTDEKFLAPAPAPPYGANLRVFNGTNPNGLWQLFVFDDQGRDGGRIDGWSLIITTTAEAATNLPRLSINDVLVPEGNAGTTPANFSVTLSAPSASEVTVHYNTVPITATADADYIPQTGTVTFPVGITTQPISILVKGDTLQEPNETFAVQLDSAVNASILDGSGTATITDLTDTPVPNDAFSNAQPASGNSFSITGTINGATIETGEPFHAGSSNSQSVWFKWTAPNSGRVLASTEGSTFDTVLAVYTGSAINQLTSVASNNDAPGVTTSAVKFDAVAGKTYFIAIAASNKRGDVILNLALQVPYSGNYQGLISTVANEPARGLLNITISSLGKFTGTVTYLGKSYPVKGAFSATGNFTTSISRDGDVPLQVVLHLDLADGAERITGSVSDGTTIANVLAASSHFATAPFPASLAHTFVIPGSPDGIGGVPRGNGSGTLKRTKKGAIRVAGRLGDNKVFLYSTVLSKDLTWPFYLGLYKKTGAISGIVQFRDQSDSDADGSLAWRKPAAGIDTTVVFLASEYMPPATFNTRALMSFDATNGVGTATLAGMNLPNSPVTHTINFKSKNLINITDPTSDKLTLVVTTKNGLVTGTLKHAANATQAEVAGVLFQKTGKARGLFKDLNTTGSLEVTP